MMGGKGKSADSNAQMRMMGKRIDMMQLMVVEQGIMTAPKGAAPAPTK
jgi:hypothetical protein